MGTLHHDLLLLEGEQVARLVGLAGGGRSDHVVGRLGFEDEHADRGLRIDQILCFARVRHEICSRRMRAVVLGTLALAKSTT